MRLRGSTAFPITRSRDGWSRSIPEAEFTPRVALTEKERADLLFGVKVALTDTTGLLQPGLPATVETRAASASAQ